MPLTHTKDLFAKALMFGHQAALNGEGHNGGAQAKGLEKKVWSFHDIPWAV